MSSFGSGPGNPPPAAGAAQSVQDQINAGATFSATAKLPQLPAFGGGSVGLGGTVPTLPFSLCGFKLPGPIPFGFSFNVPPFAIPLPNFALAVGISCDGIKNGHPLNFAAGVEWGGGRKSLSDPDPDLDDDA